jgi:Mg2+/Co2+ transporter CorB
VPLYKIKKHLNEYPDDKKSQRLFGLREKSDRTLIAILIGNNLVNVALSIYASQLGQSILE